MISRSLVSNAFWLLLSHLLSRGSLMLSTVILARALDTDAFMAYSYFNLTVQMLVSYAAMGLGITASRFFAEVGHEKTNSDPLPLGTLWCLSVIFALGAGLIILILPENILGTGINLPRWLLVSGVCIAVLQVVPSGAILGLERYKQILMVSATAGITMLFAAWWAGAHNAPIAAMSAVVVTALLQTLGETVIVVRAVGWKRVTYGCRLRWREVKRVLSFAGPMFFVTILAGSGTWLLGRIILSEPGGVFAFALYSIGLQWFSLALLLPGILSRVILPGLVRKASFTEYGFQARLFARKSIIISIGTAIAFTFIGILFGPWMLEIYGNNYSVNRWLISAYLGAAIAVAPINPIASVVIANNGQRLWLNLTIVWLCSLVVGGLYTAKYGAWSGAITLTFAGIIFALFASLSAKKRGWL